jgi:hypothetical protein
MLTIISCRALINKDKEIFGSIEKRAENHAVSAKKLTPTELTNFTR